MTGADLTGAAFAAVAATTGMPAPTPTTTAAATMRLTEPTANRLGRALTGSMKSDSSHTPAR
ncbi:hypothetical protein [Kitasatospora sp. NPDC056531]|uniref:hypothetical protein n=1 Tax=Kitasatospora sp. NPDC056531 TaxID=3345856 RepID=UPI003695376F